MQFAMPMPVLPFERWAKLDFREGPISFSLMWVQALVRHSRIPNVPKVNRYPWRYTRRYNLGDADEQGTACTTRELRRSCITIQPSDYIGALSGAAEFWPLESKNTAKGVMLAVQMWTW